MCPLSRLIEFDIDGAGLEGALPGGFGACFPELRELDLSYNELTGAIPAEITGAKSLQEFKVDYNRLSGELPAGLGGLPKIQWLRFSENRFTGQIPADLAASADSLLQLQLHNNALEGDLYALKGHSFVSFTGAPCVLPWLPALCALRSVAPLTNLPFSRRKPQPTGTPASAGWSRSARATRTASPSGGRGSGCPARRRLRTASTRERVSARAPCAGA